jgi:hypothetical protein
MLFWLYNPPFGHVIAQLMRERFHPTLMICKQLGMTPTNLGVISGGLTHSSPDRRNINIYEKGKMMDIITGYLSANIVTKTYYFSVVSFVFCYRVV